MDQEAFEPLGYATTRPPLSGCQPSSAKPFQHEVFADSDGARESAAATAADSTRAEADFPPLAAAASSAGSHSLSSLKLSICVSLLVRGRPQAFIDFFSMPLEELEGIQVDGEGKHSTSLRRLADACAASEAAAAAGKFERALAISQNTAEFLASQGAHRSSTYLQHMCLNMAAETPPSPVLAALLRDIGKQLPPGPSTAASANKKASLLLSREMGSREPPADGRQEQLPEEIQLCCQRPLWPLERATRRRPREKLQSDWSNEGRLDEAVKIRRRCLDFARLSEDDSLQWNALHSLGLTLKEKGQPVPQRSVANDCELLPFRQRSNKTRECRARAALAAAYVAMERDKEAVEELETLLELATQTANAPVQAHACASLSVLYQQNGKEEKAVELCQRHFDFASKSGDMEGLEAARASLGLAKAKLQLPTFRRLVCEDVQGLAKWKCTLTAQTQK
ncbi:hypothetical protein Efla_001528 [Eimeria flavescens]